ncbi:MAG: ADP-ribosylglycohydrolase family protein [Clostridia bacterium]|nr:ADP-ribosylglycohydrolase family protein [Clostridia bacterium]
MFNQNKADKTNYRISIMGDSISTFEGFNPPHYYVHYTRQVADKNGLTGVDDTWWKQVIDNLGGELCVNNSYSGSVVVGRGVKPACSEQRCIGLHTDYAPDIILIYMGTNDRGYEVEIGIDEPNNPLKFYGAYRLMLRQLKENYPSAKIVCATVPVGYIKGCENILTSDSFLEDVREYNQAIKLAVKDEDCLLADIAHSGERYETFDGCHPTKSGHDTLARLWLECLNKNVSRRYEDYVITKKVIENGIYGLAIGDALGVPYEFLTRDELNKNSCVDMVGGGIHKQLAGTWSDDTSMTLASMDGLENFLRDGDYSHIINRFAAWLFDSEYTVDGVFDAGRTCISAISKFVNGTCALKCGCREERDNGNGSLMRILPAVFFSIEKYGKIEEEFIQNMSALTHGHRISVTACKIYAHIVWAIINDLPLRESIINAVKIADTNKLSAFDRMRKESFFDLPQEYIKSSGYVVDTLEAATWCLCNTENFRECTLKAVNLGEDTDTVAAVAGSLAGLLYGKDMIPASWMKKLRAKSKIDDIISRFYIALKRGV